MIARLFMVGILVIALLLSGCGRSPEEARKDLSDKKIQYTEQSFVKAVEDNDANVVELFLEAGMSPNIITDNGNPLITAAASGNLEIMKLLIEKGADVNIKRKIVGKDKAELTPVLAVILGKGKGTDKQEAFKLLLDKGADLNVQFISKGFEATPLMMAVLQNDTEIIKLIVSKKIDINAADANTGLTALMLAVSNNNVDAVKELVAKGADVNRKDKKNGTALSVAKSNNNPEMISVLTNAGAK
ncbi:ankyrin repeat domain-containing protein [Sporomusa malonica]|uniref:Ankyrin repeat-containing protein n=1 Tax=Sporomusa malonica TaxID=112901 RepID=A0A1W1ZL25_9FIRM|nr:ankyrin repeat domain-containing protein [Sporomusa malonica]SMC48751.1 Ankyrin repeat-containing protein [Sporomusa malonica]